MCKDPSGTLEPLKQGVSIRFGISEVAEDALRCTKFPPKIKGSSIYTALDAGPESQVEKGDASFL